jgi:ABC-type branched-subunit amino acid transport system substrate-binding protein
MAIDKAGTATDQEKIREAVKNLTWDSPQGKIKFNDQGDSGVPAHVLVFKDGQYHVVK